MANSPEQMAQAMLDNLPAKTGKTLAQWLAITKKLKLQKHGEVVETLKSDHGVTHGFANLIAHHHFAKGLVSDTGALVDAQYAGPKSALRPIYNAVIKFVKTLGADVEISPKKTYVSLRRRKQFALIQASTKDRVDLGLNLKGMPATERLEPSGSFNAMVSHRVRLTAVSDIDQQLENWLQAAFDAA